MTLLNNLKIFSTKESRWNNKIHKIANIPIYCNNNRLIKQIVMVEMNKRKNLGNRVLSTIFRREWGKKMVRNRI